MAQIIRNPVLPGFHPDPSICRVDGDYYVAVSTFEWFPGVGIYHSRDLVNWEQYPYALTRRSQLEMRGVGSSCGIWAPCLSFDGDRFYLVYTIVQSAKWPVLQTNNYVVTSRQAGGPWSEPVRLNNSGIDPSLFHDTDGRSWLVNQYADFRCGGSLFSGIVLQEYAKHEGRLIGSSRKIWEGTSLRITEGPHIYRKDGYYYLICAEGGTHFGHAVSVARSRDVWGPYEVHPGNPICTSRDKPHLALQKAGHGSLVQTPEGEWYMAHLCARPVENPQYGDGLEMHKQRMCILGRETAIQKLVWEEGEWPVMAHGSPDPLVEVPAPDVETCEFSRPGQRIAFFPDTDLDIRLQSLREPVEESWCSRMENPGILRLKGRNFFHSTYDQSLLGCRVESLRTEVTTAVRFSPRSIKQWAGLAAFYDEDSYYYCCITCNDDLQPVLTLLTSDRGTRAADKAQIPVDSSVQWHLRFALDRQWIQFFYRIEESPWEKIGPALNATYLSDDAGYNRFTGLFAALCCQDCENRTAFADFAFLEVKTLT